MRSPTIRSVLAAGLLLGTLGARGQVAPDAEAPDFRLSDVNGAEITLASFRGKFVVLEWFNHDCPFVKKHYGSGNMPALQKKFADQGVIWLSICSSSPGKQGNYSAEKQAELAREKNSSATAVLLDPEGTVGRAYGAKTTPHMFVINPEGRVIYQGAIDSVASANPDDITGAENYVKGALESALAGQPVAKKVTAPYGCSVKY